MRINDNIAALRVYTSLIRTDRSIARSTLRLSSGFRINGAGDDPSGFAISLKLSNQMRAKDMADRNTLDGTSLLETADAALQTLHNMVQRIRELAVAAANDTNVQEDRVNIQMEIDQLLEEVDDLTRKVEFNNIRLLNGEAQNIRIQVGGRKNMSIPLVLPPFRTWDLGLANHPYFTVDPANRPDGVVDPNGSVPPSSDPLNDNRWARAIEEWNTIGSGAPDSPNFPHMFIDVDELIVGSEDSWMHVTSVALASLTIHVADQALHTISLNRAQIGAFINRFEYTSNSLRAASEATARSLSRVRDTDMAYEMMELSKFNILSQAAMAIKAQVNARPQQVLQLLG
jgi:flagellin